jgi:hypothetical protein
VAVRARSLHPHIPSSFEGGLLHFSHVPERSALEASFPGVRFSGTMSGSSQLK